MFWDFIRSRVKAAVLAGFGDAIAELEHGGQADAGDAASSLMERLQPMLAAPREQAMEPAHTNGNGKRRRE